MHIIQGKTDHIPQAEAEAEIDLKMEGIKTGEHVKWRDRQKKEPETPHWGDGEQGHPPTV